MALVSKERLTHGTLGQDNATAPHTRDVSLAIGL